ncbi:MAG TPA: hypothetical protein VNL77_18660 [Roseiflexaceae bacterium]|nr:hypothetical protein [Roseiflexaceae bacterium]
MFVLRPILHHFLIWLLLAPLLLVEMYSLDALLRVVALQDEGRARVVLAEVVEQRRGADGPEVRYRFTLPGHPEQYFARGPLGGRVWAPITEAAWRQTQRDGALRVRYLPEDPWANQPEGRAGHPVADSFCMWGLFVVFDLIWLAESVTILRNFAHCQAMVERRRPHRARFWESRHVPDRRYSPHGWRTGGRP